MSREPVTQECRAHPHVSNAMPIALAAIEVEETFDGPRFALGVA